MQKNLYAWLLDVLNIVAVSSLFLPFPRWIGAAAGIILFADYWIKRQSGR